MSIANRINEITKHLENDYINIEALVGEVSEDKNIENIAPILDTLWEELPKVTGEDTSLNLNNTKKGKMKTTLKGNTYQDGEPTPDTPQEIEVVTGLNEVEVCSKNLFNDTLELGNISNTTGQNNTSTTVIRSVGYTNVLPNTTYTISNSINVYIGLRFYKNDDSFLSSENATSNPRTFTTPADCYKVRFVFVTTDTTINVQLEKGSTATTYEAYKGQTYEVNLGSLKMCKIGDYEDYFYKDNGNWYLHKEIGKVVLDGNESWGFGTTKDITQVYSLFNYFTDKMLNEDTFLCNYFINQSGDTEKITFHQNTFYLALNKTTASTVEQLKIWLSTHNTEVYYVLATPTDTQITDTTLVNQLEAVWRANSYDNQTNVSQTNSSLPFIISASALEKLSS